MKKTLIVNSELMGSGSDELGRQLIGSFFRKLWAADNKPRRILFYNSAVKLLAKGSPVLEALNGLAEAGVDLIACGTCVTYFDLKENIIVGRVSDMTEISTAMLNDNHTVTL